MTAIELCDVTLNYLLSLENFCSCHIIKLSYNKEL